MEVQFSHSLMGQVRMSSSLYLRLSFLLTTLLLGLEMVRLPSYGVIKMYKCKHGKFQMIAAILQIHICLVVIIIIVIPR